MDLLIIGAGLSGAVIAREFANQNKKVLILEKRNHIGGNVFDFKKEGITIHKYGPHIFHTNSDLVYEYMKPHWELNDYRNRVLGFVKNHLIPIPFNFKGVDTFFPKDAKEIKELLIKKYGKGSKVSILELRKAQSPLLKNVSDFIYKNIFENYTTKMWGLSPEKIDPSVTARVPILISYKDTYFQDKYEGIPKKGYTSAIQSLLDHPNIKIKISIDGSKALKLHNKKIYFEDKELKIPIVYSGRIDELFNYSEGTLDYRSLEIKFETINKTQFQEVGVVNYPAHPTMTRITEYKHFTQEKVDSITIISKEYPGAFKLNDHRFGEPYYPLATDKANEQYRIYTSKAKQFKNLHLCGRLATYKYINMDQTILNALNLSKKLLEDNDG